MNFLDAALGGNWSGGFKQGWDMMTNLRNQQQQEQLQRMQMEQMKLKMDEQRQLQETKNKITQGFTPIQQTMATEHNPVDYETGNIQPSSKTTETVFKDSPFIALARRIHGDEVAKMAQTLAQSGQPMEALKMIMEKPQYIGIPEGGLFNPRNNQIIQGQPKPPTSDYAGFRVAMKEQNPNATEMEISNEWQKRQIALARGKGEGSEHRAVGRDAANLRKEFNNLQTVKDFNDVSGKYAVMQQALQEAKTSNNLVAADQAIITLFNKMTDPTSVVRESEYARTPQDLALMNRLKGKVAKLGTGGAGLTLDDRNAIVNMAEKFYSVYKNRYLEKENEYREYASMQGIEPDRVLRPLSKKSSVTSTPYASFVDATGKQKFIDTKETYDEMQAAGMLPANVKIGPQSNTSKIRTGAEFNKNVRFLQMAKDRNDAKVRLAQIRDQGWSVDEAREMARMTKWD